MTAHDSSAAKIDLKIDAGFGEATYHFITFLYAAAVHLVIHNAHVAGHHEVGASIFVLLLILYLFSDWASRTRLPRLLPEEPTGPYLVMKSLLEIACVFFLVSAFVLVVSPAPGPVEAWSMTAALAFGLYLIMSFLWDLLVIRLMKELDVVDLWKAVWHGTALDMKEAQERYLLLFWKWKAEAERKIVEIWERRVSATTELEGTASQSLQQAQAGGDAITSTKRKVRIFEAALAPFVQIVANHMLYANLLAGILLIVNVGIGYSPVDAILSRIYNKNVVSLDILASWTWPWWGSYVLLAIGLICCGATLKGWKGGGTAAVLVISVAIPLLLGDKQLLPLVGVVSAAVFLSSIFYYHRPRKWANIWGGRIILGTVFTLYLTLPLQFLVGIMVAQHVLINAFLQIGVGAGLQPRNSQPGVASNPLSRVDGNAPTPTTT